MHTISSHLLMPIVEMTCVLTYCPCFAICCSVQAVAMRPRLRSPAVATGAGACLQLQLLANDTTGESTPYGREDIVSFLQG